MVMFSRIPGLGYVDVLCFSVFDTVFNVLSCFLSYYYRYVFYDCLGYHGLALSRVCVFSHSNNLFSSSES